MLYLVSCWIFTFQTNYYGDVDEYCAECQKDSDTGVYVSECPGGRLDPVALEGWYYNPLDVTTDSGKLLCDPLRLPEFSDRSECPHVMKCGGFNNECLGLGGGSSSRNFPFLDKSIEEILKPSGNITCKVAPDTPLCSRCANKVVSGAKIDDTQMEQCNEECRWACTPINGAAYNVVQFGNRCSKGTMGDLCNDCVEGFYKMNNRCEVCPNNTWVLVLCAIGACLCGGFAFYLFETYNVNVAICNIFIDFAQVIAIFVGTDVPWPDDLRTLFSYLSVLNFNLVELLGIECSIELSYADKFFMYQVAPLVLLGACLFIYGTLELAARLMHAPEKIRKLRTLGDNIVGGYLIVFNLMYLSLCRSAMDIFNCREMVQPDGYSYMASTYDQCYESGGPHMEILPYAVLSVIFYCVGFPVALSTALWWNRK